MHNLILFLPLFILILLIYYPWHVVAPAFLVILIGSLIIYWKVLQSQRKPPVTGTKAMVGRTARVVKTEDRSVEVEYEGETWYAISSQHLHPGQTVIIQGVEGLTLRVAPTGKTAD